MSRARTKAVTTVFAVFVVSASFAGGVGAQSSDGVTLTVTVVDEGGNPLSDASLSATWDGGGPVNRTTAGNGKAFVDVAEGADVTVRVDHPHYVRNQPYVVENASGGDVTIEVARAGRATVTVAGAEGPLDNAIVRMFHDGQPVINERTAADGRFTTPEIERGNYTLVTFKEGYLRNRTTLTVDGQVDERTTIRQESVLVTFSVSDDHFDPPRAVTNANVTVPGVADVTTQGTGTVSVSMPVNDVYEVTVTKPGYDSVTERLSVRESETALNATIQRTPAIGVRADNDRVVVGEPVRVTVTDEYGAPVANASVSRAGTSIGETDEDGVLSVPIESAGNVTITAESEGRTAETTVEGVGSGGASTATAAGTATDSSTGTPTETSGGFGPGFGVAGALVAVLVGALAARRRGE
ncbi:PGF-CTERM sorting domain-containing protein [Halosimplex litoreum]|uniref:PGF-CTERM sorting domain-containing protein n=1 Tax=Halosimplex litoreum TaxID=1198301 RepID=A0A7T3FWG1_9EURY|nr:PGF-CTERM sorting domain-containing protein [Halosimplex litoreum]QPV61955.1 PGF-CTERM sorting domain-containing protein [Halosimplex litoreum]